MLESRPSDNSFMQVKYNSFDAAGHTNFLAIADRNPGCCVLWTLITVINMSDAGQVLD